MKRDTIIWDVDGTLYQPNTEHYARCLTAAGLAARELGYPGSQEEAEALARQGFELQYNGLEIFCRDYPMSMHDLHKRYHEYIDISDMPPYARLATFMRRTDHTHAILTHGSTDWGKRVAAQRQLLSFFISEHIMGMEQYDFRNRSVDETALKTLLARMDKRPEQCIIVDDSHRNLSIPHAMGMETVLVYHLLEEPLLYVTHQFKTPEAFMQHLHRQQPRGASHRLL